MVYFPLASIYGDTIVIHSIFLKKKKKKTFNLVYAKYNFSHTLFFKSPWYSVITEIRPEKNYLTSCISLWLGLGFGLL